jgi:hypothetical protein
MSTLKVDAIVDSSNGNTATINSGTPVSTTSTQVVKAWVNFDGTGTVAIRASYNVTDITDNGTGDYTVNFATAMPDADYSVSAMTGDPQQTGAGAVGVAFFDAGFSNNGLSASNLRFRTSTEGGTARDGSTVCVSIFR